MCEARSHAAGFCWNAEHPFFEPTLPPFHAGGNQLPQGLIEGCCTRTNGSLSTSNISLASVRCAALTATGTVAGATLSSTEHHGGSAGLRHRNHGQHTHHQQHGQRRELHHGGRRVHGDIDGLRRSNRCESLGCTFTATSGGVSTGSVVCGDVTSSGTVFVPQLFVSNTLTVTNTSDFSDDLNWGLEQAASVQQQRGPRQRPGATAGQPERQGLLGAGRRGAPVRTQLSLTTNQRNPGCLVIAGKVVKKSSLYYPINFRFLVQKRSQISAKKRLSPAKSPLRHRSVFGAKSAENGELRKVRFSCPASNVLPGPPNSLVFC